MFPIRDTIRSRSFPLVNWILIILNGLVFLYELSLPSSRLEEVIYTFGLVPANLRLDSPLSLLPFLTHMFLHGGWVHFLSNVWVLYIFGDNVEDRMGSGRYLLFYLLGGFASGLLQTLLGGYSTLPSIGASGAIAAVMGAYFLFYPGARVTTLIPIFILPWFIDIPAILYLGFWFVSQFFSGVLSLATSGGEAMGGVAWWAHVGGFFFGLLLARLFENRNYYRKWYTDEYYPW